MEKTTSTNSTTLTSSEEKSETSSSQKGKDLYPTRERIEYLVKAWEAGNLRKALEAIQEE